MLSDFFLRQKDTKRTDHPSHSAAIWGKEKRYFTEIGNDTFDDDSIFGKAYQKNAKLVFFGTPLSKACTFIHYIEQKKRVPYRYNRAYTTKITKNGKTIENKILFYYKYSYFYTDMRALENSARKTGILREEKIGDGLIQVVNTKRLYALGNKELERDTFFLLRNDSFFRIFNYMALPIIKYVSWLAKLLDRIAIKVLR